MAKHTHRGTCQACGRTHAVKNKSGNLAKHGYTVDWGFFRGTCYGSGELPLEQETFLTNKMIAACYNRAADLRKMTAEDITRVTINRTIIGEQGYPVRRDIEVSSQAELDQYGSPTKYEHYVDLKLKDIYRTADHLCSHATDLERLIVERHGKDLIEAEENKIERARFPGFRNLAEGYAKARELEAEGFKCRVTRSKFDGVVVTGRKVVAQ